MPDVSRRYFRSKGKMHRNATLPTLRSPLLASVMTSVLGRADSFCKRFGLRMPIVLGPMAGTSPTSLSAAVANAGGMGACGALLMPPEEIARWAEELRALTSGPFQINLWIPDPAPHRDAIQEAAVRAFLSHWGP